MTFPQPPWNLFGVYHKPELDRLVFELESSGIKHQIKIESGEPKPYCLWVHDDDLQKAADTLFTNLEWYQNSRLPAFVRFHYIFPTGEHPLTPPAIRKRYLHQVHDSALVIWRVAIIGRFGIRSGVDEFACRTDDFGGFELGYTRPAKGSGRIWLCTGKETIFSTDRFSDDLLAWFRQIAAVLNQMFRDAVIEKDCGYDA